MIVPPDLDRVEHQVRCEEWKVFKSPVLPSQGPLIPALCKPGVTHTSARLLSNWKLKQIS